MPEQKPATEAIVFRPIGVIRTPYNDWAPNQPIEQEQAIGKFEVVVDERYAPALRDLDRFRYVTLIYFLDRIRGDPAMIVTPPWAKGRSAGMFATRTPHRPNPIGISVVRLVKVQGNRIWTWPIDVFDNTPLLDVKPYFKDLDSKPDANYGWVEDLEGREHLLEHVRGVPHDHDHDHHADRDHHHHGRKGDGER